MGGKEAKLQAQFSVMKDLPTVCLWYFLTEAEREDSMSPWSTQSLFDITTRFAFYLKTYEVSFLF